MAYHAMRWWRHSNSLRAKRLLDVVGATAGLVLLGPPAVLSGALISRKTKLSLVLQQPRPGLGQAPFVLLKIRTLNGEGRVAGRVGALTRQLGLDEVPQLLNVLRGDMSLVGPRPLLVDPSRFGEGHPRYELPPGLTGLAQVSGRESLTLSQRARLDALYVRNRSMLLDVRVLAKTPWTLVAHKSDVQGRGLGRADDLDACV